MEANTPNDEILTIKELAALLKVKPSWIYGETSRGPQSRIPFLKIGKHLRFERKRVLESFGLVRSALQHES